MKKILALLVLLITVVTAKSDSYVESYNVISDRYINLIQETPIIRQINGGTVIIPVFDESCPEEMKSPFSYACKIVEEYMPPCLPLKVKVSCDILNGASSKAISKVLARSKENFGKSVYYNNAQMSVIKGVILAELSHESTVTYLDYVPNVEFLTQNPDIEITYNSQRLDEISFSMGNDPGQNYDFVSLVVRDLLIGLGLSSSYRYNPVTKGLLEPSHELTPFESSINDKLGDATDPVEKLTKATAGELILSDNGLYSMKLYAPTQWQNGVSLNYFIPQDGCAVSNILSYDFCKGMVTRSLSDNYANFIFRNLLGWKADYLSSESTPSYSSGGSTSLLMPYNGTISFNNASHIITHAQDTIGHNTGIQSINRSINNDLKQYLKSFQPFLYNGDNVADEGISISVLKKDGTWDILQHIDMYLPDIHLNFSNYTFHYDESQYARTIDGYLRARITTQWRDNFGRINCSSTFFVIDYLPQKVNLSYAFVNSTSTTSTAANQSTNLVRIYFSNTEGVDRIILEKLRKGARVPGKIEITDVKKGYYETTVNNTTTFTAVGYNENGTSTGPSITVNPVSKRLVLDFKLSDHYIHIENLETVLYDYNYTIASLDFSADSKILQSGSTTGNIDISDLPEGMYVLTVVDPVSGMSETFKFQK